MPSSDPLARAVEAADRISAAMAALDRSVREDVRRDLDTLLGLARRADGALDRIAKADEERTDIMREEARDRKALAKRTEERREAWIGRVWAAPGVQLVITGILLAILQWLGMSYLLDQTPFPHAILSAPVQEGGDGPAESPR